jgi:hypothetical protein
MVMVMVVSVGLDTKKIPLTFLRFFRAILKILFSVSHIGNGDYHIRDRDWIIAIRYCHIRDRIEDKIITMVIGTVSQFQRKLKT